MLLPVFFTAVSIVLISFGCGRDDPDPASDDQTDAHEEMADDNNVDIVNMSELSDEESFWRFMSEYCGMAYNGSLTTATEGFDLLEGDEQLIVHFRECSDDELRLPFHIESEPGQWDRSRTWVFFNHGSDGLELRHDHRHEDGTEEVNTWYGGDAVEGGEHWQRFVYPPRTEEVGEFMGWRVEIHPGDRYTYGTMRGDAWTFRVDFDLTSPVDPPPAPWGF